MQVKNQLANQQGQNEEKKQPRFSLFMQVPAIKELVNNSLQDKKKAERFTTAIISAVSANSQLQNCDAMTVISSALLGESLGLSPSPQLGHYYMVPFKNSKKNRIDAQFQLGYKGYIQLAIRSGQYKSIGVTDIREGELISYNRLYDTIDLDFIQDDEEREQKEVIGYVATFELVNGFKKVLYWSKKKMLTHADKYSQAFSKDGETVQTKFGTYKRVSYEDYKAGNYPEKDSWLYSSHWYKDFNGMAYKTMLRQLISKWGIMSIEMQSALENDYAVMNADGSKTYADDLIEIEPQEVDMTAAQLQQETQNAAQTQQQQSNQPQQSQDYNEEPF